MVDSKGVRYLKQCDATMKRIIDAVGPFTLVTKKRHFVALCEAIVYQQLSIKAAGTIFKRFRGLFCRNLPTADGLLALTDEQLRSAGISKQKIGYLRDLADKFAAGESGDKDCAWVKRLSRMSDDDVVASLTQVKGVGVWTAQMFLIFVLGRPDVLPVDDLGLRKAVQASYGLKELPASKELSTIAERWRPHRSMATWYLWQSLRIKPM